MRCTKTFYFIYPPFSDYKEYHTDATVKFIVTLPQDKLSKFEEEGMHKAFKLQSSLATSSMVGLALSTLTPHMYGWSTMAIHIFILALLYYYFYFLLDFITFIFYFLLDFTLFLLHLFLSDFITFI